MSKIRLNQECSFAGDLLCHNAKDKRGGFHIRKGQQGPNTTAQNCFFSLEGVLSSRYFWTVKIKTFILASCWKIYFYSPFLSFYRLLLLLFLLFFFLNLNFSFDFLSFSLFPSWLCVSQPSSRFCCWRRKAELSFYFMRNSYCLAMFLVLLWNVLWPVISCSPPLIMCFVSSFIWLKYSESGQKGATKFPWLRP